MKAVKVMGIILLSTLVGAAVGAGLGYMLGVLSPGFVNGLFGGAAVAWPAAQTGLGLGIANGSGMGFIVGILAVCVEAFGKKRPD